MEVPRLDRAGRRLTTDGIRGTLIVALRVSTSYATCFCDPGFLGRFTCNSMSKGFRSER
jgi:hypothetical protein